MEVTNSKADRQQNPPVTSSDLNDHLTRLINGQTALGRLPTMQRVNTLHDNTHYVTLFGAACILFAGFSLVGGQPLPSMALATIGGLAFFGEGINLGMHWSLRKGLKTTKDLQNAHYQRLTEYLSNTSLDTGQLQKLQQQAQGPQPIGVSNIVWQGFIGAVNKKSANEPVR